MRVETLKFASLRVTPAGADQTGRTAKQQKPSGHGRSSVHVPSTAVAAMANFIWSRWSFLPKSTPAGRDNCDRARIHAKTGQSRRVAQLGDWKPQTSSLPRPAPSLMRN
jgi:hypothetical protein